MTSVVGVVVGKLTKLYLLNIFGDQRNSSKIESFVRINKCQLWVY